MKCFPNFIDIAMRLPILIITLLPFQKLKNSIGIKRTDSQPSPYLATGTTTIIFIIIILVIISTLIENIAKVGKVP
jgi:hypothetical protein